MHRWLDGKEGEEHTRCCRCYITYVSDRDGSITWYSMVMMSRCSLIVCTSMASYRCCVPNRASKPSSFEATTQPISTNASASLSYTLLTLPSASSCTISHSVSYLVLLVALVSFGHSWRPLASPPSQLSYLRWGGMHPHAFTSILCHAPLHIFTMHSLWYASCSLLPLRSLAGPEARLA